MMNNPTDGDGSISCSGRNPNPCLVCSLDGRNLSTSPTSHRSSPVGPYEGIDDCYKWQHRFSSAAGDFMYQRGTVCDRSLLFQGQELNCGESLGTIEVKWQSIDWEDGSLKAQAGASLSKVAHPLYTILTDTHDHTYLHM